MYSARAVINEATSYIKKVHWTRLHALSKMFIIGMPEGLNSEIWGAAHNLLSRRVSWRPLDGHFLKKFMKSASNLLKLYGETCIWDAQFNICSL